MATRSFELSATIPVDASDVIEFMSDLNRHRGFHPYYHHAEIVGSGSGLGGPWIDWSVVERPKFGPFRYTIRFPTRMLRSSVTSLVATVRAAPGCSLVSTYQAEPTEGGCILSEASVITAPAFLVGYMTSQARLAHSRTFSVLPARLVV